MPFTFTFEVDGVPQLNRAFNRVIDHIEDLRPVWERVEREFYDIEKSQFRSEGGAGKGGKWKQLSRKYAEWKARHYPGASILQRSGKMMRSLTSKTGDTVLIKEKQEFGIGTSLDYPVFHQRGTSRLPQREVISFGEDQKRDMQKGIQLGLLEIIKRDPQIISHIGFN